jgi:hypothetical protein
VEHIGFISRSGTMGSRSDAVLEIKMDGEVMLRSKLKLLPTRSNVTIVSGTTEDDCSERGTSGQHSGGRVCEAAPLGLKRRSSEEKDAQEDA